jgi:hypothetical protein
VNNSSISTVLTSSGTGASGKLAALACTHNDLSGGEYQNGGQCCANSCHPHRTARLACASHQDNPCCFGLGVYLQPHCIQRKRCEPHSVLPALF